MSRTRAIPVATLVSLSREYFETVCKGNTDNFTFSAIAEYISKKTGIQIKEHSVRRCSGVREYYKQICSSVSEISRKAKNVLSEYKKLKERCTVLEKETERLALELAEKKKFVVSQSVALQKMRRILEENVNEQIAIELLKGILAMNSY